MTKPKVKNYVSIAQSLGITGFVILTMILLSFVLPSLNKSIGSSSTALLFQLLAMGIPFIIVRRRLRKKDLGNPFNMTLKNKRIFPFIIVGGVVLLLGVTG